MRNQPALVPELGGARIENPPQCRIGRRCPVREQNWLPNYERSNLLVPKLRYDLLECRGPLQTDGSSRGQKEQHPDIILRRVEVTGVSSDSDG